MDVQPLEAATTDGLTLRGEIVRGDETFVVCVHGVGEDIDIWRPLRPGLAKPGWTLLALDLRGHGGSDGEWSDAQGDLDVAASIRLARQWGARHVCVVTSGFAGILALRAVAQAQANDALELPDSLVLISPGPLGGLDPMTLRGRGLSRLFFYGGRDASAKTDVIALRRAAIGWHVTIGFGTEAQRAKLIAERPVQIVDKITSFLTEQRTLPGPGQIRAERRVQADAG